MQCAKTNQLYYSIKLFICSVWQVVVVHLSSAVIYWESGTGTPSAGLMPTEARGSYLPEPPYLRETKTYHSQPLESTRHAGNYFVPLSIRPIFTARYYASVVLAMGLCPSVSVTSRSSTKTAKHRITQTTRQRSPRNLNGVTPYEGAECR